jgi:hypothetical protein
MGMERSTGVGRVDRARTRRSSRRQRPPDRALSNRAVQRLRREGGVTGDGFGERITSPHGGLSNRAVQRLVGEEGAAVGLVGERIASRLGGGEVLDPVLAGRLSAALGADVTGVRVHTDPESDALAASLSAAAFTTGRDIFFRTGLFDPTSPAGLHLLVHELVHILQQRAGPVPGHDPGDGVAVSDPQDACEVTAEVTARSVMSGLPAAVRPPRWAAADGHEGGRGVAVQRWWVGTPHPVGGGTTVPGSGCWTR